MRTGKLFTPVDTGKPSFGYAGKDFLRVALGMGGVAEAQYGFDDWLQNGVLAKAAIEKYGKAR